jgi:hypothetical protein
MDEIRKSRKQFSDADLFSFDDNLSALAKPIKQSEHVTILSKGVRPPRDSALDMIKAGQHLLSLPTLDRATEDAKYLYSQQLMNDVLFKSLSSDPVADAYDNLNSELRDEDKAALIDQEDFRRAISSISTAWNSLGVFRSDFNKNDNDKMARNAYVAMVEKGFLDYFGSLDWDIQDTESGDRIDYAYDFMHQPNPQESFADMIVPAIRDLFRYDAGAIIKTFNRRKELVELKTYLGTEFWIEMDRVPQIISVPSNDNIGIRATEFTSEKTPGKEILMQGWWSRGFTWRYWQRSQTGVYIPYTPSEVCYLVRYKRSDNIYGTDYLKFLKYWVQYLIDSTVAAGKSFQNGMVPSMIIQHPSIYNIDQIQGRIMQMRVDNTGPQRMGQTLHLVNGEDAKSIAQHLHDMEWVEGQKFVAQLIWGFFGFTPDEFVGGDTNRATAYVKRNITKSRLLYPMMHYIEDKINREILPFMKGYKKTWKFAFIRELELDDKQKIAQTGAIRMGSISAGLTQGIPARLAYKIANDEVLTRLDLEELEQAAEKLRMTAMNGGMMGGEGGGGGLEDQDQGRYGTGSETYQPVNFGDYGQGGENTEQRMGNKEDQEYQKAYYPGKIWYENGRKYEITFANDTIAKAKVYVKNVEDVPEGRSFKQGTRGSIYYLTTLKQQTRQGSGKKKKRKGGSAGGGDEGGGGEEGEHSAPEAPDIEGAKSTVKVTGNGVGVSAGIVNGKLVAQQLKNPETAEFLKKVMECSGGPKDPAKFIQCMKKIAEDEGLEVSG